VNEVRFGGTDATLKVGAGETVIIVVAERTPLGCTGGQWYLIGQISI